jgi:hypothetical protein
MERRLDAFRNSRFAQDSGPACHSSTQGSRGRICDPQFLLATSETAFDQKRTNMIIARVAFCAAVLLIPYRATAVKTDVLIRHAAVVDVEHALISPDQAVATKGDRIVAVGNDAEIAAAWGAARQVDGKGRFLIPGLWDMHVHFGGGAELVEENKALLPLYVAYGVTTVRDCSGDLANDVLNWRREITEGKLFGPRLLSSGPKIEGIKPVWKGTLETGSEVDVDQAVAKLVALKVDFVKITDNTLKPELFLMRCAARA